MDSLGNDVEGFAEHSLGEDTPASKDETPAPKTPGPGPVGNENSPQPVVEPAETPDQVGETPTPEIKKAPTPCRRRTAAKSSAKAKAKAKSSRKNPRSKHHQPSGSSVAKAKAQAKSKGKHREQSKKPDSNKGKVASKRAEKDAVERKLHSVIRLKMVTEVMDVAFETVTAIQFELDQLHGTSQSVEVTLNNFCV